MYNCGAMKLLGFTGTCGIEILIAYDTICDGDETGWIDG